MSIHDIENTHTTYQLFFSIHSFHSECYQNMKGYFKKYRVYFLFYIYKIFFMENFHIGSGPQANYLMYLVFVVAKLLYNYKCPSFCMSVCKLCLSWNAIFRPPIKIYVHLSGYKRQKCNKRNAFFSTLIR